MRLAIKETEVYQLSELDRYTQEYAYNKWRETNEFFDDFLIDDFTAIGACIGIEIYKVKWSGFWSQGDGASFIGRYEYKKGWKKALADYCNEYELVRIGQALQREQSKYFYKLHANVTDGRGNYSHKNSVIIDVTHADDYDRWGCVNIPESDSDCVEELLKDFMDYMYKSLDKEYEDQNSFESFRVYCDDNDCFFEEDGGRYYE